MFGFAVDADADGQLDASLEGAFEEGEQAVSGWVPGPFGVLVEVADFFLVNGDRKYLLLLEFVGVVFFALDDHQSVVLVESDFRGDEEDFGEEVLLLEQFLVVGLFKLPAFVSHRTIINA